MKKILLLILLSVFVLSDNVTFPVSSGGNIGPSKSDTVNVKALGVENDGSIDVSAKLNTILSEHRSVYIPSGTYKAHNIIVPGDTKILTDGYSTIIDNSGATGDTNRIVELNGSNISIGKLTLIGSITTETDEQSHAIFVSSTQTDIKNIDIGGIKGKNIRGDVLYIDQSDASSNTTSNIDVGEVLGDNVLRNVVSITGGSNIHIGTIIGDRIGLNAIDIEPEHYNAVVTAVTVDYIKGRSVGIVAATPTMYIDDITLNQLDLSPDYSSDSSPSYAHYSDIGLQLRNIKTLKIGSANIRDTQSFAIKTTFSAGEMGVKNLLIDKLSISNCGQDSDKTAPNTECINLQNIGNIHIGHLSINIPSTDTNVSRVFDAVKNMTIDNIDSNIEVNAALFRNSHDVTIGSGSVKGGYMGVASTNISASNIIFDGARWAAYSSSVNATDSTITTSSYVSNAGHERNKFKNTRGLGKR